MITLTNECIIELISIDTNEYQGGDHGGVYLSAVDGTDNWIKDNSGFLATVSREVEENGKVHFDPQDGQGLIVGHSWRQECPTVTNLAVTLYTAPNHRTNSLTQIDTIYLICPIQCTHRLDRRACTYVPTRRTWTAQSPGPR